VAPVVETKHYAIDALGTQIVDRLDSHQQGLAPNHGSAVDRLQDHDLGRLVGGDQPVLHDRLSRIAVYVGSGSADEHAVAGNSRRHPKIQRKRPGTIIAGSKWPRA
jgi:hypothetical protein